MNPTEEDEEKTRQLADSIYSWLHRGEDFTKLARIYSTDRDTKDERGILGELTSGNLEGMSFPSNHSTPVK